MKESSYNCSQETDILVDFTDDIIVRILGVRIQAFDIKNENYSKGLNKYFFCKLKKSLRLKNFTKKQLFTKI